MEFSQGLDKGDYVFIKSIELIDNNEIDNIPLGFFIEGVFKYYSTFLMDNLKEINLTQRQCYILLALVAEDQIHQEHLAYVLNSNEVGITRDINYLEKEGLIVRKSDDSDKRKKLVFITEKGLEYSNILNDVNDNIVNELSGDFNTDEIRILKFFLKKMYLVLGNIVKDEKKI